MMLENFIRDYEKKGVRFWVENEQLKFRAPAGVLSIEDKEQLKEKKKRFFPTIKRLRSLRLSQTPTINMSRFC